jgi:drug/metabolite transporter superfamily protein YnfA
VKMVVNIIGAVLMMLGAVWVVQGLNLLGGSFMSGQTQWTVIGLIVALVGAALLAVNWRRRRVRVDRRD